MRFTEALNRRKNPKIDYVILEQPLMKSSIKYVLRNMKGKAEFETKEIPKRSQ